MLIKLHNKKINLKKQNNVVLFANSNLDINKLDLGPIKKYQNLIIENVKLNKENIKHFLNFNLSPSLRIIIIKVDNDIKLSNNNEKLGAKFFEHIKKNIISNTYFLDTNIKNFTSLNKNFFDQFIFGTLIKSYSFNIYKTKKELKNFQINIHGNFKINFEKKNNKYDSLIQGINFTKDLVSEPGNILHPDEYANRIKKLKSLGLKVTIFDKKKLKKIGMNALLGVGQGSIRGSYLVTIEWHGAQNKKEQPLAF